MSEPRIVSIDPVTGVATWETPVGSTMQTAYAGLPAPLQQQYQQHVADQYTSGLQSVEPPAASMPNDNAPFVAYSPSENMSAPAPTAREVGSGVQTATPVMAPPASRVQSTESRAAGAGNASTSFADPLAAGPAAQPSRLQELLDIQAYNPNARVGGAPGRLMNVQGPTQTNRRVADPSLGEAVNRLGAAESQLADTQQRELMPAIIKREAAAAEMANQALAAEDAQVQIADVNRRRAEALAAQRQKYETISAEHIAAEQQGIDPNRYFANQSTGDRIMSGIGLILGGIGAGLTGRENVAFKVIDDAIERDIMAQRENLAAKGRAAERARGVMADVAAAYDDEAAQVLAARGLLWDASGRRIAELEAMATNDEARANLASLREQAAVKKAQIDIELASQLGANIVTSERQAMVGGSAGTPVKDLIAAERARRQGATYNPELYVPQYGGVARTSDEAKKARELASNSNTVDDIYRQALQIRSRFGNFTDPRARAALAQLQQQALLLNKNVEQLGALSDGDKGVITGLQGGDWDSFSNFNDATINQARKNLRVKERNLAREMIIELAPEDLPEHERQRSSAASRSAAVEGFQPIGGR